ncbi:MAG TPA: acyltransferase [Gammaproteobacteria bacterium]|nr:acyltransferase [Gammaproteobacteria bacterium]
MNLKQKARDSLRGLLRDPFEAFRLASILLATAKFRYLRRCAGPGSVFGTGNRIINAANVTIGRHCLFQDFIYVRAGVHGRITFGDRCAINSFCQFYGHGGITLGDDTQVGPGTVITTTHHDYLGDLGESFRPVTIGRRVWIGANVTVLSGVTIGDGAVIGAGAVVTADIPARTIAVGVPARVIRDLEGTIRGVGTSASSVR